MLFHSPVFLFLFLPITLLGVWLCLECLRVRRYALVWLLACSLFFYGYWKPDFLPILILSIAVNFMMAGAIATRVARAQPVRLWLTLGLCFNLGLLGYFKYALFAVGSVNQIFGTAFDIGAVLLPIGISFFTFKQIAYLVDAARGEPIDRNPLTYALFITFFPHLIAGPILHHRDIMPQFNRLDRFRITAETLAVGASIFILGLFKKIVLADGVAVYANPVFDAAATDVSIGFVEAWVGALAYSFQLYFDFSGYSDMALGLARMMGIHIAINFFAPYKSTSIIDFWRRWHITLSRFLRDYLYIPLGGNRGSYGQQARNLMITMGLGGLWHGAAWTFAAWGALHGIYLIVNHAWNRLRIPLPKPVSILVTFICVVVGWVLFRAADFETALALYQAMLGLNGWIGALPQDGGVMLWDQTWLPSVQKSFAGAALLLGGLGIIIWALPSSAEIFKAQIETTPPAIPDTRFRWSPSLATAVLAGILAAISLLSMNRLSEFLYFQF